MTQWIRFFALAGAFQCLACSKPTAPAPATRQWPDWAPSPNRVREIKVDYFETGGGLSDPIFDTEFPRDRYTALIYCFGDSRPFPGGTPDTLTVRGRIRLIDDADRVTVIQLLFGYDLQTTIWWVVHDGDCGSQMLMPADSTQAIDSLMQTLAGTAK